MKSSESKEETPIEWKDPLEAYKYVCDGAKVQCMFCASPGTLKATSTKIKLQDKPFATAGDKDGKVNFNFQGPCMHPSQQKPNVPPPPCKSIISLGQWMNVSKTFIGNERALLAGSTIVCSISGAPIRIIHSGQKATLENLFMMDSPAMRMSSKEKAPIEKTIIEKANDSSPLLSVTSVTGKTTALPFEEVEYEVTGYNLTDISDSDRKNVKWVILIDGKQELQKQQGEKIQLTIKEEWIDKEITVMPYLNEPTEKVSMKTNILNTKHYKVIPSIGSIRKSFDLPSQMSQYMINNRKTNEITIQRLEKKIPFHSAVVELGIKKITNDYNTRFSNGFPDDYYSEFGRYITELLIYKHQQIELDAPIKEALNEVVKLLDSENGFNNGLGAPLFHIYENVVRKNNDTGFDKLLHFMFSAKHAYNLSATISKSLGIAKEFIKDEMYSWISDDEKGWDDLDMKANTKGIEYGTELKSK